MIPDTVDYAQARFGVRADGSVFAMSSFFQKLAKALGGAGVAGPSWRWRATWPMPNRPRHPWNAIRSLMTLAPAAIMVVMIVAALAYPLSRQAHAELGRRTQVLIPRSDPCSKLFPGARGVPPSNWTPEPALDSAGVA